MILGHEKTVLDLKRLADKGGLSHGYVFFGPRGVGKKLVALSLAGYLESGVFEERKMLYDCLLIVPDEKRTIGIDAARSLKGFLWQKPNVGSRRVAVIDQAELMTEEAQNALLRITEEPPPSALLILVTQDIESLKYTLASRFQKIYFSIIPREEIAVWLINDLSLAKGNAENIAKRSFGKPGLAYALVKDKEFGKLLKLAESVMLAGAATRRDLIKKVMADDKFNLEVFLDAVIILAAEWKSDSETKMKFWHKMLNLRGKAQYLNLNPRLQLESLFFNS